MSQENKSLINETITVENIIDGVFIIESYRLGSNIYDYCCYGSSDENNEDGCETNSDDVKSENMLFSVFSGIGTTFVGFMIGFGLVGSAGRLVSTLGIGCLNLRLMEKRRERLERRIKYLKNNKS